MSAIALMALLGLAVFAPVLMDSGEDDTNGVETPPEPVEPVDTVDQPAPVDPAAPPAPETAPTETPVDPAAPVDPVPATSANTLNGTLGNDRLVASEDTPVINGNAGNDTLTSIIDGLAAVLDGGEGEDVLETDVLVGFPDVTQGAQTLTGGAGSDDFIINLDVTRLSEESVDGPLVIITDFSAETDTLEINPTSFPRATLEYQGITQVVADDGSFTDLDLRFADSTGTDPDIIATIRLQGVNGISSADYAVNEGREVIEGTEGDDTLRSSGNDTDRFDGLDTLRGLAGDDVLIHEARDSSGPLVMEGGDGNDTLTANEVEFGNQTTLDGGPGDDVLQTDLFLFGGGANGSFDTFITGEGADRIEISYINVSGIESADVGLLGRVTDFNPDEDVIAVDPRWLIREIGEGESSAFAQLVTLREDPDGTFTDLEFTYTSQATEAQFSGIIRLEGLTDLTEDDIAVLQIGDGAPGFDRPGIIVGT